uniref:gap junction beta-2 protein-like n=1 Tax=Ciona intestinalis TaxID=7719 RepID=UPI0002B8D699|nr:gap junction beta-2 protein-like [Ciona intestinalis]|eukprot:XP_004225771.1 gap junction beta-2 protein-like [Ciona intestinalis]
MFSGTFINELPRYGLNYATFAGKVWYVLVYLFRLVVVVSLGTAVYYDEQEQFRCSTVIVGCEMVCYDEFAKISHLRFWAFQILALNFPVVLFHFYAVYESGKIKNRKRKNRNKENRVVWKLNYPSMTRGNIKEEKRTRKRFVHNEYGRTEAIVISWKIEIAYFVATLLRGLLEAMFIFFAFILFMPNLMQTGSYTLLDSIWVEVPRMYQCRGESIYVACEQHMLPGNRGGYVPCWVSRPWEKTIFVRYMNIMSAVCLVLTFMESVYLTTKFCRKYFTKKQKRTVPYVSSQNTHKLKALKAALKDYPPGNFYHISKQTSFRFATHFSSEECSHEKGVYLSITKI